MSLSWNGERLSRVTRTLKLETLTIIEAHSEGKQHSVVFCLSRDGVACVETANTITVRANTLDRAVKHLSDRYRTTKIVRLDEAS